jgi:hypothetical protein
VLARRFALALVLGGLALPQSPPAPRITVCELLKDRARYNYKMVAARGLLLVTQEEGFFLFGVGCDDVLASKGYNWEPRLHVEIPKRLDDAFSPGLLSLPRDNKVTVTIIGVFETYNDLASRVHSTRDGLRGFGYGGDGFGARGSAPARLIVKSIDFAGAEVGGPWIRR